MSKRLLLLCVALAVPLACSSSQPESPAPGDPVSKPTASPNNATPSPAPTTPPASTTPPAVDANHPLTGPTVRLLGRFDNSNTTVGAVFAWPASCMLTRVLGTGLSINLVDSTSFTYQGVAVSNLYDVYVDGILGSPLKIVPGVSSYIVAEKLPQGDHIIRVCKRTEAQIGTAIFNGFVPLSGGTLLPAPLALARRLEFIGDSITAGYGADGNVATASGCAFTAATENADATFASMTAAALNAEFFAIGFSGKGISQNDDCTGDPYYTLPILYPGIIPLQNKADWDFTSWIPQAVVINLGTNDYNMANGCAAPSNTAFTQAWVNFIQVVRGHYPNAAIFCTVAPELHAPQLAIAQANIQSAVASLTAAGDSKLFYLPLPEDTGANGYGCDGHPNRATHAAMASVVTAAIKSQMHW